MNLRMSISQNELLEGAGRLSHARQVAAVNIDPISSQGRSGVNRQGLRPAGFRDSRGTTAM
jgi:hypothetical protein